MERRGGLAVADEGFERKLAQESSAIRQEIRQEIAALRADMATRAELEVVRQDLAALRADVTTMGATMSTRSEMNALRQETTAGFARLERQIADSRVESIKWSFLFWTGQCLTIIGFLIVFLRNR
jgi:hypothetical protein